MAKINNKWLAVTPEAKTANFNAANGGVYLVSPAGSTLNVQLPSPSSGISFIVKDASGDIANKTITLVRAGSENIDGAAANKVLTSNYQSFTLVSDGTDWFII